MRLVLFSAVVALLVSGCALRPRYADFVSAKTEGKEVTFVVTDTATGKPVPGAKIEVSELRNRVTVTSGADGTFRLPVDKRYVDENPVFVVTLPKGVEQYEVKLAPPPPPAPAPAPAPVEAPAAAAPEAADAGTP
jgi:hypothetical protein